MTRYGKAWQVGDSGHAEEHNIIARRMDERLNIQDFDASTSSSDNTAAIQAALDEAAVHGLIVYIPPGTWKTTGTLRIKGEHSGLCGRGTLQHSGTGYALEFGNTDYPSGGAYSRLYLGGVTIVGSSRGAGGVRSFAATRSVIEGVEIKGYSAGVGLLYEDHGWTNVLRDCGIGGCDVAVRFKTTPPSGTYPGNAVTIGGGEISGSRIGILVGNEDQDEPAAPIAATSLLVQGVTFQSLSAWAVWLVDGRSISVSNCYFEDNGTTDETGHVRIGNGLGAYPTAVTIRENQMVNNASSGGRCVVVENINHGLIAENMFYANRTNNIAVKVNAHTALKASHNYMAANIGTGYEGISES